MGIAVISMHGKPLSPTTPAKARKLIQSGGAVPRRDTLGTFYIQLTTPTGEIIPHDTVVGIDPGKRYSGVGVQTPQATLWIGHLVLPFPVVKKAMGSRRQSRRFRRYRKTRQRSIRFRHRAGHKMPPSIKANRELEWRVLHELAKIYPITHVVYEVVKARGTQSFSPVMVGQQWQMDRIVRRWPLIPRRGWETAQLRFALDLKKTSKKAQRSPASHAVDGVALASSHFLQYVSYETATEHGQHWEGTCRVTDAPFAVIQRPLLFRRALHFQNPLARGQRKRKGGTVTPYGVRKGDWVEATQAEKTVCGYISGYTTGKLSLADARWHRLGQFAVSKVHLSGGQRGCSSRRFRPPTAND